MVVATLHSCKKDPENITGCTDSTADNYNAQATESNNSCTYVNRFVGQYAGKFKCAQLLNAILAEQDVVISPLTGDPSSIKFDVQTDYGLLSFSGKIVSPDTIEVDDTVKDIPLNLGDLVNGLPETNIKAEFKIVSTMVMSQDRKTLSGDVFGNLSTKDTFELFGVVNNGASFNDNCTFVGTKK